MEQVKRLPLSVLERYPRPDAEAIHHQFLEEWKGFGRKIAVLDDDPTGVQTVHDIHVYTDWSRESLEEGMQEENAMFFILTNSRSFSAEKTAWEHETLVRRAVQAAGQAGKELIFVARGDSTLRGHYLLEPQVIRKTLEKETGKRIHGLVVCPFFREGGRFTINGIHYVKEGEELVPAAQTEFAADKTFGYRASHLGDYVEEKSGGAYSGKQCIYITLPLLRARAYDEITGMLLRAEDFCPVCVDAICESDVEVFATCLLRAIKKGKEFVIRSAAAVPKVLGNVPDKAPLSRQELLGGQNSGAEGIFGCGEEARMQGDSGCGEESAACAASAGKDIREAETGSGGSAVRAAACGTTAEYGGLVLVGSHVKKTTAQLETLRGTRSSVAFVEFHVNACLLPDGLEEETRRVIRRAEALMGQGKTAVVYTSRTLMAPDGMSGDELLELSVRISDAVTGVVAGLTRQPRFLIAKGGITSSDVGTRALGVKRALVLGQAAPGIPVWKTGPESKFPGLPYIIFPGNVGDADTLREIVERLA